MKKLAPEAIDTGMTMQAKETPLRCLKKISWWLYEKRLWQS
jgi:hypothetical protein